MTEERLPQKWRNRIAKLKLLATTISADNEVVREGHETLDLCDP